MVENALGGTRISITPEDICFRPFDDAETDPAAPCPAKMTIFIIIDLGGCIACAFALRSTSCEHARWRVLSVYMLPDPDFPIELLDILSGALRLCPVLWGTNLAGQHIGVDPRVTSQVVRGIGQKG